MDVQPEAMLKNRARLRISKSEYESYHERRIRCFIA